MGRGKGSAAITAVAVLLLGLFALSQPLLSGPPGDQAGGSRALVLPHRPQAALVEGDMALPFAGGGAAPEPCPHDDSRCGASSANSSGGGSADSSGGGSGNTGGSGTFNVVGGWRVAADPASSGGTNSDGDDALTPRLSAWLATRKGVGFGAVLP